MSENTRRVGVSIIAARCRKARQTVILAITEGRLPADELEIGGGRRVYLVDPSDADRLWPTDIPISA
ncbi:Uncharacterised protein [Mycobacteroides abscessus subsp. abscessus]|uniref:hypothetical protein n=1 Tax=Mycobacteroides TaxID=670516 RepID=UPI000925D5DB|nr:hypothetical protein [Mycobacteroides abscessus]MDB2220701.1 hypothetical protein [Mycobacteroides abscessus subsp. abscessus]SHT05109.1 Uncharacterised protein [Mycobacteroides abscessus subsp. abscessus]SID00562.1 Uncharacterised protein [Mycobacteroides abscessus subsp. abscessus]SIL38869.1 Uncharacterised protein [Mycobacteroides abscessus subsp. abscessus]SIM11819.1 Uncharacterised protein [Mycobacteroides abscessus subsp. abscessus]